MLTPFIEHPVQIKNRAGDILTTSNVGDDSIIVILASALPNWYLQGKTCDEFCDTLSVLCDTLQMVKLLSF